MQPQLGGLGFLPFNIGMTTAIGSLLLLAWNAFGYPLLEAKFRPLGCFQLGTPKAQALSRAPAYHSAAFLTN